MEVGNEKKKKMIPVPQNVRENIFKAEEPFILKNVITWKVLSWSLEDWARELKDKKLDVRSGLSQCTKMPQWENSCETLSATLSDLMHNHHVESSGRWIYFDYKHMKQSFKDNHDLLECLSWRDLGFPEKDGKDSTIWIGTKGAYTPCHMDSYGCNIVAQVYGRKLWVLFPPTRTSVLKPTRVPYEESSVYSNINFSCGLNVSHEVGDARVVELCPGDVLVVPKHWWHYVENLSTAISINTWIPLDADHRSRLEESLVRFFITLIMKAPDTEGVTNLLNPNEKDLLDEPVDLRQISWCLENLPTATDSGDSKPSCPPALPGCSPAPSLSPEQLQEKLLKKCGCDRRLDTDHLPPPSVSVGKIIDAFCHPGVISKVADILICTRNTPKTSE